MRGLARNALDYAPQQVNFPPLQSTAIAKPQPGKIAQCHQKPHISGGAVDQKGDLLDGQRLLAVVFGGGAVDIAKRVFGSDLARIGQGLEKAVEKLQILVKGARRALLPDLLHESGGNLRVYVGKQPGGGGMFIYPAGKAVVIAPVIGCGGMSGDGVGGETLATGGAFGATHEEPPAVDDGGAAV